jgi:UDP-N-acetylglucosamine 2-epimerase (non-hydrolysing)
MLKIAVILGTRPEAIKLLPVYMALKKSSKIEAILISTGQHKEMLQQVFELFNVKPDTQLSVMEPNQSVNRLFSKILDALEYEFAQNNYDGVIVQGDTTTTVSAAMAAYHKKIKIFHVEAGLRSYDHNNPFPEEANRKVTSVYTALHFTPTEKATNALENEGYSSDTIIEVGNTVIDALQIVNKNVIININHYYSNFQMLSNNRKFILITCHRRESFGLGLKNICEAISHLATKYKEIDFVYPVHLNPNVKGTVEQQLGAISNIKLLPPISYDEMLFLLNECYFILTDSGGIQEEAPSFRKPVLVMRETSERMEGIEQGCAKLLGSNAKNIVQESSILIEDEEQYNRMIPNQNPYGNGQSSAKIVEALIKYFE